MGSTSFRTAVMTLMAGAASSQLITLLLSPILARLYSVADFGQWALFAAVSALLGAVSTGKYDSAVMLPQSEQDARKVSFACLVHVGGCSLLISFCLFVAFSFSYDIGGVNFGSWALLPISVFAIGLNLTFSALLNRAGAYRHISRSRIFQSIVVAFVNLIGWIPLKNGFGDGGFILILGTVLGQISGAIMVASGYGLKKVRLLISRSYYDYTLARKYYDFPLYSMPEAALGAVLSSFPVYAFTYIFDNSVAGQYSLAQRCLMLPVAILGGAISQVNFRNFSRLCTERSLPRAALLTAWARSAAIALLPAILLFTFGEEAFFILFGSQWHLAGEMAVLLAIPVFITFIFSTGSGAHVVLRIQHASLVFAVVSLLSKILVLVLWGSETATMFLLLLSIVDILVTLAMNGYALTKTEKSTL